MTNSSNSTAVNGVPLTVNIVSRIPNLGNNSALQRDELRCLLHFPTADVTVYFAVVVKAEVVFALVVFVKERKALFFRFGGVDDRSCGVRWLREDKTEYENFKATRFSWSNFFLEMSCFSKFPLVEQKHLALPFSSAACDCELSPLLVSCGRVPSSFSHWQSFFVWLTR